MPVLLSIGLGLCDLSSLTNGSGEILENILGSVPVDASVGNADTSLQARGTLGGNLLVALVEVRLDHDTDNGVLTCAELVGDDLGDLGLVSVILEGVAWELNQYVFVEPIQRLTYRESSQSS